jgi:hypothetical protein
LARYGFHGEVPETKILVLYALNCLSMPVTTDSLAELAMTDEGVDYFHYCQALAEMADSGHVISSANDRGEIVYSISPRGYEVSELMDNQLGFALKTALKRGAQMLETSVERDTFITANTFQRGGVPGALCQLTDGTDTVLNIEIMLNDKSQGSSIVRNFRKNAEDIYEQVLKILLE